MYLLLILILVKTLDARCQSGVNRNCCDDIEMYLQCQHVQNSIIGYANYIIRLNQSYQLISLIPNLGCDEHIVCCGNAGNDFMCQNIDSYNICLGANDVLNNFIKTILNYVDVPPVLISQKPNFTCVKDKYAYEYVNQASSSMDLMWKIVPMLFIFLF